MSEQSPPPGTEDRDPPPRRPAALPPSIVAQQEQRSQRVLLVALRLCYIVLLVTVTLLPFVGAITDLPEEASVWVYVVPFAATFIFGVLVLVIDASMPNKRLATVFGVYLGILAGLVGALAIGAVLELIAKSWDLEDKAPWNVYLGLVKLAIAITLCYLAVSIVLTTKDDFRLVIPYVEFAKQLRGTRPLLVDSSVLIDGRIDTLGSTGFLDAPLVVPRFVIDELQTLADSGDRLKRTRGRRGLGVVTTLQANPRVDVSVDDLDVPGHSVDHKLLHLGGEQQLRILTTDTNLQRVARIHGVDVLNLNDLATAVKSQAIPGQTLHVEVVKRGESPGQGVGYMPDGTMCVIEDAAERIGDDVAFEVTNALQTSAGRMIFGRLAPDVVPPAGTPAPDPPDEHGEPSSTGSDQMARAATSQPRQTERPGRRPARAPESRRNPRR
ncbi:MAG: TRAM domain-containing protein [Planctomycetota bacterium]